MKLETLKEKEKKKTTIYFFLGAIILLLSVVLVYRTYSIYREKQTFDIIKGNVPDQNYDVMFTFYLADKNGKKHMLHTVPEDKEYEVIISCNNEAQGRWNYEKWGPVITNLTNIRTKCNITFTKFQKSIHDYGIEDEIVTNGTGIYEVTHPEEELIEPFSTQLTDLEIRKLKLKEYRYAGTNPNNYVTFNEELAGWRLIGLVNTPQGQRLKLVRNQSIGARIWDSTVTTINQGEGVNEYGNSNIHRYLNDDTYSASYYAKSLKDSTKKIIDIITWNTGTNGYTNWQSISTIGYYNYERSNNTGKICNGGSSCNSSYERSTIWTGQVGLIYPSDYGYATSGGSTIVEMIV